MKTLIAACLGLAVLGGCGAAPDRTRYDDLEVVQRAAYRHDGPPALTLYTMVSNKTGAGAHTSLMINGSQRVIFDPAGSVQHPDIAERGDVLFGFETAPGPQTGSGYEKSLGSVLRLGV